jgi:hypothetical protein
VAAQRPNGHRLRDPDLGFFHLLLLLLLMLLLLLLLLMLVDLPRIHRRWRHTASGGHSPATGSVIYRDTYLVAAGPRVRGDSGYLDKGIFRSTTLLMTISS